MKTNLVLESIDEILSKPRALKAGFEHLYHEHRYGNPDTMRITRNDVAEWLGQYEDILSHEAWD